MVSHATTAGQFVDFDGHVQANSTLDQFGTFECAQFRDRIISSFPVLSIHIRAEYLRISQKHSYVQADLQLLKRDAQLLH